MNIEPQQLQAFFQKLSELGYRHALVDSQVMSCLMPDCAGGWRRCQIADLTVWEDDLLPAGTGIRVLPADFNGGSSPPLE